MKCRHCASQLNHVFVDLGFAPPSNAYLCREDLNKPEICYPLRVMVCENCWLVQTEDYARADMLFNEDYAYLSSTSSSWQKHAELYSKDIIERLSLDKNSYVVEVASNDGYLLKNFVEAGIPCLGIEPALRAANIAERSGVPVLSEFFTETTGKQLAENGKQADLIIGNNVYAHVPDINNFTRGLKTLLKPGGLITLEFPHLMKLIEFNQFDTIYHEHFSYFSLYTVIKIFQYAGLRVWNVEELNTHGGSLRIYGCHEDDQREGNSKIAEILMSEQQKGLQELATFQGFQIKADEIKYDFLSFLIKEKKEGKSIAGYGAAAKANTLLNYSGVGADLLPYICDASSAKQGKYMPGNHIPILSPASLMDGHLDHLVIFPWNLVDEIRNQEASLRKQGTQFVTLIPRLVIT